MFALHFGTCCVMAHRGGGVTFWYVGLSSFLCWKLIVGFVFVSHYLSFIVILFSWSLLHALCSNVGSEMVGTREKLICVISFSERDGSEQPCSLFVPFELCKISVLSSRTPRPDPFLTSDRLESGLLCVRWSRFLLFIIAYANQSKSSFSRARTANEKYVWDEKLSIGFSPLKNKQTNKKPLEVSLSPPAWIFDTVYTEREKALFLFSPYDLSFTLRL